MPCIIYGNEYRGLVKSNKYTSNDCITDKAYKQVHNIPTYAQDCSGSNRQLVFEPVVQVLHKEGDDSVPVNCTDTV